MPEAIFLILFLGLASFLLTMIIRKIALKRLIFDIPNERSLHSSPTPFGGGIAIVLTWYTGLTIFYLAGLVDKALFLALMSGIIIAVISFIDDIIGIKPYIRLCVHFITSTLAFWFLGGLRPLIIPGFAANMEFIIYPLAVIGMVWFINLYNFMDGIDGFSSTEAIIICSVLFVFTWNLTTVLLISCISGFLYWNWPKARIFMGDVGSTQIGFIIVIMGIYFHNVLDFSILNWIMLTSPFWFDATLTLLRRLRNRENLSQAHRKHVYQRIVQAGYSHKSVICFLLLINIVNIFIIGVYREIKFLQVPLFVLTLVFYYFITLRVDRMVPFRKD